MKATELLNQQHRQLDALFDQIESAAGAEARRLVGDLATILVGHMAIEKETFYPACEADMGASAALRQALEEHTLMAYALQKLLSTDPGDERFHARRAVLRDVVQRHVLEEDELIARVDLEMDEDRLEDLGERMESRYEENQDEDASAILARELQREAPRTIRRKVAKKPARRVATKPARARKAPARAAKKRGAEKRGAEKRGAEKRGAEKAGRKAPGRKKAGKVRAETAARGEPERGTKKGGRAAKGARKGRSASAR